MLAAFAVDITRYLFLIQPIDPAEFVEQRPDRRQGKNGKIVLHPLPGRPPGPDLFPRRGILQRRQIRHRGVEVQDLGIRQPAHYLLFPGRKGMPRGSGKANDLFHVIPPALCAHIQCSSPPVRACARWSGGPRWRRKGPRPAWRSGPRR